MPLSTAGDLVNFRIVVSPIHLVKHDVNIDKAEVIWPFNKSFSFKNNESLDYIVENKIYLLKWIEDPDYYEEMIVRNINNSEIVSRKSGYL